jgi:secreted PhoX family phosphatase
VAVDNVGNLVTTSSSANRVLVVPAATGTFYGRAMTARHIYSIAGDGKYGYRGDGGPATKARLAYPWGVAVDSFGNVLIAADQNNRIRLVAEQTGTFYGQAMTAGDIYTIAGDGGRGYSGDGGPATSAELYFPQTARVDAAGNLVIADTFNDRVRVVAEHTGTFYGQAMTAGDIYTVAGDGRCKHSGNGIPATTASLCSPGAVAVDAAGNLVITDAGHRRVRVVAESNGTFYGQAKTAGDIYTVAGNGVAGCGGNRGPATKAEPASRRTSPSTARATY